jgi:membrane protein implicated in regulation of membrane protease activity
MSAGKIGGAQMETWWESLTSVNKAFALGALFFTIVFVWQIIGMLLGMHGDSHGVADSEIAHETVGHAHGDLQTEDPHAHAQVTFTLVSLRSILAFGMLFSWAGTLYLMNGASLTMTVIYSSVWGMAAMFVVSYAVYKLVQLQETGNIALWTAIGEEGTVYMDIPAGGTGKIRVITSRVVSYVNARSRGAAKLPAGTKVRVVGILDNNTLEVEAVEYIEGR